MRTNRSIIAVAVVVVLVVATAGIAAAVTTGEQADQPSKEIQVAGSADVSAQPDQAILRVGVVATADNASTARDRLAENVTSMQATLEELGIPDDRIETDHYDIGEVRERPDVERDSEYRAVHAFEITLNDTDGVGDVIDAVVDNGANRIQGVSFTLSDDRRHELRQDALEAAMDRARTDAETLATSAELEVVGAASISASDVHMTPYRVERPMMESAGDAAVSTSVASGPVDVSASVQVVYNATSA